MLADLIPVPTSSDKLFHVKALSRTHYLPLRSRFHITLDMAALAQLINYAAAERLATVRIYMSIKFSFPSNEKKKNSHSMVSRPGQFQAPKVDESPTQLRRRCYWYTTAH
jgi:hypothetical protein